MSRSIRVRPDLVLRVKLAVKHNGFLRQQDLVEEVGLASSTVRNFLNGKRVNYATFVELCQRLNLEWRDFADTGEITELHRESEEAVIAQYSTSETEKTTLDTLDLAEREEAIVKPHQESGEAVDTFPTSILSAERYNTLEKLLKAGKWREADEETNNVMVKVAGREKECWLDSVHIEKFPCSDLRTIDTLWVRYSKEHFGFSVQTRIWQSVGRPYEPDGEIYERFCEYVGWSKKLVHTGASSPTVVTQLTLSLDKST